MTSSGEVPAPGTAREDAPAERAANEDLSSFDRAINDLQSRIADLRVSVDEIGHGGATAAPPPPPSEYAPPPPPEYAPPPPPAPPEPPAPAGEPPPEVFLDAPAPTMATPAEGSDAAGSFSRVDVGPFEDLLAMTAFEEQLSALPSMADVRVRRFGTGRAEFELEAAPGVPLAREIMRVAPDALTGHLADGTLTVELRAERWTGPVEERGEPPAPENPDDADGARG